MKKILYLGLIAFFIIGFVVLLKVWPTIDLYGKIAGTIVCIGGIIAWIVLSIKEK